MIKTLIEKEVPLKPYVSMKAGGAADLFMRAAAVEQLFSAFKFAMAESLPVTLLGQGSNVLPSDEGVEGLTVVNRCDRITVGDDGMVEAETGCSLQDLFLEAAQSALSGLEFAVGIPGTLGGALASNAGAYRSSISEHIAELEVCDASGVRWVQPDYMDFTYRHSKLRDPIHLVFFVSRVRFRLPAGKCADIYHRAKDFQRQRISKQPPPASSGSFFKNVNSHELAQSLPNLPNSLRDAGVVPAGYLIEACDLKGYRHKGAQISSRHANFIVNIGGASARDIRELAMLAKERVLAKFGVEIEEEVLYIGRWNEKGKGHARD